MHFTAQCTLVQSAVLRSHVVCLSVRSSVTLVDCDHKDWKTWKLIAQTISRTLLLFVAKRRSTYSPGNMEKFGETRGGVRKRGVLVNKSGNISEIRKERKSYYGLEGLYRTHQRSFEWYQLPSPTSSPSPRLGVRNPTQNCNRKSRGNECTVVTVRVRSSLPKLGTHPYQTPDYVTSAPTYIGLRITVHR